MPSRNRFLSPSSRAPSPAGRRLGRIVRRNLGETLRGVARASVAAAALGAAGCASSHFPAESELEAPACEGSTWQATEGLNPTREVDYLAAFDASFFVPEPSLRHETGERCGGATDAAACEAAVEESSTADGNHVILTAGDEVSALYGAEELLGFLGSIDTPNEALLRAWHAGYSVGCDDLSRSAVREVEGGYEVIATQLTRDCDPVETTRFLLFVAADGAITVLESEVIESQDGVCVGRRPPGLRPARSAPRGGVTARFFADVARLEDSAVDAFRILAAELEAHGAPAVLVARALEAADDEVRHAARMGEVARRLGAEPGPVEVEPRPVRPLFEIALENATEGCVRETFGAVVGHHQAMRAADPDVAAAMAEIADDETRHAELSWAIAAWIEPRLSDRQRATIRAARASAVRTLRAEMRREPDPELVRFAGLPSAAIATATVDEMARRVWGQLARRP